MLHLPGFASGAIHGDLANLQRQSRFVPFTALLILPFGKKVSDQEPFAYQGSQVGFEKLPGLGSHEASHYKLREQ